MSVSNLPTPPRIYTVGTLRYNQPQLFVLFFWLMWNDFSIMLLEQVTNLNNILMKDHGATFTQIAVLGSIGGFITPWINPWVSTWSDRHRGKHGRRRPFLFWSTPLFAASLMAIPFMPELYHHLMRFPFTASLLSRLPISGEVVFIGACSLMAGMFNATLLAIFSYLYWDVVPEPLMGRFQSLSKNVSLIAGLIWSFFLFGLAQDHVKAVYVGTAVFCLVIYLLSVWQIKEGEYPPPDPHVKGGAFAPIRAYFVECFSQPYYLWIFAASFLYQLGNAGNWYQFNYVHYDLKMDLSTVGWTQGWSNAATTGFGLLLGFAIGSLTDRLKPVRLMAPCLVILALVLLGSYCCVHDKWTYLGWSCAKSIANFCFAVVTGAFTVEVFPREKIGQFCSAQAVFYQILVNVLGPLVARFFDRIHDNRLAFLWSAICYVLAAFVYLRVYANWTRRQGHLPIPRAG